MVIGYICIMKIRDISTRKKTIVYTDKKRKKDLQLQQHKESLVQIGKTYSVLKDKQQKLTIMDSTK